MSIIASEIIWRKSAVNDDTASNGGRMIATAIVDAVKNNLWPDVGQAERSSGSIKYRKAHCHIANDTDLPMLQSRIFVEKYTPGDDSVTVFLGNATNTQAAIGTPRLYGCGQLNAAASATDTTVEVLSEEAALDYYQVGDLVRISDKTDVDDVSGTEDIVTLTSVSAYTGDVVTLGFTGDPLANAYATNNTRVASVIEAGTIEATATNAVVTTASTGTFDDANNTMDSIATIEQAWTLTFTSATDFDIVGDTVGAQGSGTTGAGASPTNSDYSKPYFVIASAAFGGAFLSGDTITFTTSPAAQAVWMRRGVPAGATSLSANSVIVAIDGESA